VSKPTLDDCVYLCLRNGKWWTFWEIQNEIKLRENKFFGEPSISAAIRNLRKHRCRLKYGLKMTGEVIDRRRRLEGKGYQYKLIS